MTDDRYYRRREREERDRAAQCDDAGVRSIHLEMADRYAWRSAQSGGSEGAANLRAVHNTL